MSRGKTVLLECEIARSGFSGERVFRIRLANQEEHIGITPVDYCRGSDMSMIGPNEPSKGKRIKAFVEGRVLENGGDEAKIALPDGEVIKAPRERIQYVSEPKETNYVPVGS